MKRLAALPAVPVSGEVACVVGGVSSSSALAVRGGPPDNTYFGQSHGSTLSGDEVGPAES
jgi:hypothetical protein